MTSCKVLIAISLVLLLTGTLLVVSITKNGNTLIDLADKMDEELNNASPQSVDTLEEFSALWHRVEPLWHCVTTHSDLENVNEHLAAVKNAMDTGDYDKASVSAALLKGAIGAILAKEGLSMQNIL